MILIRAHCTHCSFKLETGQVFDEVTVTPELLLCVAEDHARLENHIVLWTGYAASEKCSVAQGG